MKAHKKNIKLQKHLRFYFAQHRAKCRVCEHLNLREFEREEMENISFSRLHYRNADNLHFLLRLPSCQRDTR